MAANFENKVVMVTGAGGNIGQAVARRFAAAGAKVVLVGRSESELTAVAQEIGGMVGVADVTDPASLDALVKQVESSYGKIEVLAHTVGGYNAGTPVHESGLDVWDKMMNLNARSVYVSCGRVAKHMVDHKVNGRIIAILAKNAYKGTANHSAYSASKAAAQRVIESMSAEVGKLGITVNAIVPSTIDTPQNRAGSPNADYSNWVKPEEIADAILFLAADESRAINGVSLDIAGGL
ncbi:MAG: SDR family oxidoreductase [Anaerolineae bacterium]|nr:SDR family oxidoreductase [Anaerolineae bacterium]